MKCVSIIDNSCAHSLTPPRHFTRTPHRHLLLDNGKVARAALRRLCQELQIDLDTFEQHGLWGDVCGHGQLHVKTYSKDKPGSLRMGEDGLCVKLSPHKDPSLITLLIHDCPEGGERAGLQGLQLECLSSSSGCPGSSSVEASSCGGAMKQRHWCDIDGRSGWGVATLFAGLQTY